MFLTKLQMDLPTHAQNKNHVSLFLPHSCFHVIYPVDFPQEAEKFAEIAGNNNLLNQKTVLAETKPLVDKNPYLTLTLIGHHLYL
jgi:hypothetical protein